MAKPRGFDPGFGLGFGVGRYRYALTPWVWDTSIAGMPHWRLPASSVGGVDLRPLSAQALAGGTPQGFAFAASMQPVPGIEIARSLHFGEEAVTTLMRDAWQSAMGFRPDGANLVDLLWEQLTTGSDPDGIDGPKPLMPGTDQQLTLFVGGHSLVKSEPFRFGLHPHTDKVRTLLQRDFDRLWEATNGDDHCRRVLDFQCKKLRVDDWREFVPPRLRAHVPGRLPHATTITESFDQADSPTLGPDLTWTEVTGAWDTISNAARQSDVNFLKCARAESVLSGDDHYAQATLTAWATDTQSGPAARFAAGAETFYLIGPYAGDTKLYLGKYVVGTATYLGTAPIITTSIPEAYKIECDGSTIKAYQAGVERRSETDTSITGNVRCGMTGYYSAGTAPRFNNFEAADLGGGPATYTATGALSMGSLSLSGAATFAPGVKTATAALSIAPQTLSGAASFAPGTKTATGALSIAAQTLAGSGTHTAPTYTADADLGIAAMTLTATGSFSDLSVFLIDDADAGFSHVFFTEFADGFRGRLYFAFAGSGAAVATWDFAGIAPGAYRVYATWTPHLNRATNAPFNVYDQDTATLLDTVLVNQEEQPDDLSYDGAEWETLGTFTIGGTSLRVTLDDNANDVVIADAILIVPVVVTLATAAISISPATLAGSATFSPGTKTADGALSITPATLATSATFSAGVRTAIGALTISSTTLVASASFTGPVFSGVGTLSIAGVILSGAAVFIPAGAQSGTLFGGGVFGSPLIGVS